MPLPFALDHINLWVLEDEIEGRVGYTLIDCGITSNATKRAWEQLFDGPFAAKPLLRVVCTHFHPDHFGLAHWLTAGGDKQRWTVRLWMTATEYAFGRYLSAGGGDNISGESAAQHFARNGLSDGAALQQVRERGSGYYPGLVPAVPQLHRIHKAMRLRSGRAREAHLASYRLRSRTELSLYAKTIGARGRPHGAPRISTNAACSIGSRRVPLAYLRSLDRLLMLPADTVVLPSHGKPFIGLHQRIAQQHRHHAERLGEVLAACSAPQTAASIVPVLFKRQLDLHQMTFALGEALAHLHALWYEGKLERREEASVYRFSAL